MVTSLSLYWCFVSIPALRPTAGFPAAGRRTPGTSPAGRSGRRPRPGDAAPGVGRRGVRRRRRCGSPARPGRRWPRRRHGSFRGSGTRRPPLRGADTRVSLRSQPVGGSPAGRRRPSHRTAKNRSVSGASWNQRSPISKSCAGMGPWVSWTFSATGASPRTAPGMTSTRAVR